MASAPPAYTSAPAPLMNVFSNVEIRVSCQKLVNKDVISKSDPFVVLFTEQRSGSSKAWKEHGRTETMKDNLSPKFLTPFKVEYRFEEQQNLKFEVYDSDSSSQGLSNHDFLGQCVITLGNIMGEYCGAVSKPLTHRNNVKTSGTISFVGEEMTDTKETLFLQFNASKVDKKDFFGSSDPFLVFNRHASEDNTYIPVHKTEVIKNNLNPFWKSFEISLATLCNCDKLRPIKIECYDWDSDGTHDFIGSCQVTAEEMLSGKGFPKDLRNPKKESKKNYKNSGVLHLGTVESRKVHSFLDYITGGIELCFHVAIDFTASNGIPSRPESLHYMSPGVPNKYINALFSVGKICEDYDSDKLMPAYGFGARMSGKVYHDFNLNMQQNPDCFGVMGIFDAYQRFLPHAELYGPTYFSPVIKLVTKIAQTQCEINKYHVLLILTDGVITDMDQTKLSIIEASHYPVSIIIVGIGNAEFDAMEELDSDNGHLRCGGRVAEQDIVQFVPLNKFVGNFAFDDLAKEVLREVPNQLTTYMKKHGIKPKSRVEYEGAPPMGKEVPPVGMQGYQQSMPLTDQNQGGTPYPNQGPSQPYQQQGGAFPSGPSGTGVPYPNQGVPTQNHFNQPGSAPYMNQPGNPNAPPYLNPPGTAP